MKTVLFVCIHNAGRSQMAAAWFNAMASPDKARALSAGTQPAAAVHAEVLDVMREVGVDLATSRPRRLSEELAAGAAILVTMGCGDVCSVPEEVLRDDWPLEDPKGKPVEHVRRIRDEVKARVASLIAREGWG